MKLLSNCKRFAPKFTHSQEVFLILIKKVSSGKKTETKNLQLDNF